VDDHGLFRDSLSRLLEAEPDFEIAALAATSGEGLLALDRGPVDIVLLDYDLGEEQGSQFLDLAAARGFTGRVLMVTAGMSDSVTLRALKSGVAGIFLKHSPPAQLVDAIRQVAAGENWLDPRAMSAVVSGATADTPPFGEALAPREKAVLKLVFEGLTNKEIGGKLDLSESSVKAVLQQLFEKTGVRTRAQLVRIAIEQHAGDWLTG